jgi:type II secretory pathway pseudopilin PulG
MQQRTIERDRGMRGARPVAAFTLVELLVVIAIMVILIALVMPSLLGARYNARRVQCASNMRSVHVLCTQFASDHGGTLPPSNTANPGTLKKSHRDALKVYMTKFGIPESVWYCPGLALQAPATRAPNQWPQDKSEVPIGYNYLGNPTEIQQAYYKFLNQPPYQDSPVLAGGEALATDLCAPVSKTPVATGNLVKEWSVFPHHSPDRPVSCNILFSDGNVKFLTPKEMQPRYRFDGGGLLYW